MTGLSGIPALDAAIGLVALFFLLSTVCSAFNEGLASVLGWRAKTLEDAIRNLLGEPKVTRGAWHSITGRLRPQRTEAPDLTTQVFEHWRIRALVRDPGSTRRRRARPSYLPPRAFSRALAEVVALQPKPGAGAAAPLPDAQGTLWQTTDTEILQRVREALDVLPNPHLRAMVDRAAVNTEETLDQFRGHVETAFDDAMERASGWYKRKVQLVLVIVAALLAIGLNVDTVSVATRLLNDGTLRAAVSSRAGAINQSPAEAAKALDQVEQLQLPIGWGANGPQGHDRALGQLPAWSVRRLPGWLITIAALSLGASFWFDLLSRLSRLRGSGVPERPRSLSDRPGTGGK
jgi:hypothetical protein